VYIAERLKMTGTKNDSGKLRMDLIPPEAMIALAEVLSMGANKYADHNWRKGIEYSRVLGALERHLADWKMGNRFDDESKLNHMAHVLCNVVFLMTYEREMRDDLNDLYNYNKETEHAKT